jgi:predicted nuclease of predicted toxin-antitoxin system
VRLILDHHYSPQIAVRLRDLGHDVTAVMDRDWHSEDDETLLARCRNDDIVLMTNNVADFVVIVRNWAAQGRSHHGIVFTSDASLPRHRDFIGLTVERVGSLLVAHPGDHEFVDRVHWL